MKRFLAVLAVGVVFAFTALAFLAPQASAVQWARKDIYWRTSAANVAGYVDSAAASINGAVQTVDTTATISLHDVDWLSTSSTSATSHGCMRLALTSTGAVSTDTLFYTIEVSVDGTNWATNTTFLNAINAVGTDELISIPLTCDSDAGPTVGAGTIWGYPYMRLRVRADGNTGALYPGARIVLFYPKAEGSF